MPSQNKKPSLYLYSLPAIIISAFLALSLVFAWTEPSVAPPGGNVATPLNVGNVGQSKEGGLILNTGGAATGLIVDKGNVGIGIVTTGAKLDVLGQIRIQNVGDNVLRAQQGTNDFHLIGTYSGWDSTAVYIAGYNAYTGSGGQETTKVHIGKPERLTVDFSTGNVGIGTTGPGSTLTIRRSTAGTAFTIRNTGDTANTFTISDTGSVYMTGFQLGTSATAGHVLTANASGVGTWQAAAGGAGAPTNATYITQTSNTTLTAEQALSALSTGIMKVTIGTGVVSSLTGTTNYIPKWSDSGTLSGTSNIFDNGTNVGIRTTGPTITSDRRH